MARAGRNIETDEVSTWEDLSRRLAEEVAKKPDALVLIRPMSEWTQGGSCTCWGLPRASASSVTELPQSRPKTNEGPHGQE